MFTSCQHVLHVLQEYVHSASEQTSLEYNLPPTCKKSLLHFPLLFSSVSSDVSTPAWRAGLWAALSCSGVAPDDRKRGECCLLGAIEESVVTHRSGELKHDSCIWMGLLALRGAIIKRTIN